MSAHTPGPWTFESGDNYYISSPLLPREYPHRFKDDSTGHFVAYIGNHAPDFGEANARLISAAPDMYEALTAFLHFAENNGESVFAHFGMAAIDRMNKATEKARAALAKARGQ